MTVSFKYLTVLLTYMVTIEKPKGIMITLRDRKENKSKTLTVYDTTLEEVFERIKKALSK